MKCKVVPLRFEDLTPQIVLQHVEAESEQLDEIYIYCVHKDGSSYIWSTHMEKLPYVSTVFQALAIRKLNGDL